MNEAQPGDWRIEELPPKRTSIRLDQIFSSQEMKHIRLGCVPEQMENKWFIYWKDSNLIFHRSWTGFCIYVVRFAPEPDGFRMIDAAVNRDPEQYAETSDQKDAEMIVYLIKTLLLHEETPFPSNEPSSEKKAALNWSQVGRAMLGEHPTRDDHAKK